MRGLIFCRLKKLVMYEGAKVDQYRLYSGLMKLYQEHMTLRTATIVASPSPKLAIWSKPEKGVIKISCNAAVSTNRSVIATVARDWRGSLVFTLTKIVETIVLYSKGHIESDAKICIEPFSDWALWIWDSQTKQPSFFASWSSVNNYRGCFVLCSAPLVFAMLM